MVQIVDPALSRSALFHQIAPENIHAILQCFHPRRASYKRGAPVVCADDTCQWIGLVVEGELVMTKDNAQGDRMVVGECKAGDFFGELFAFSNQETWPYSLMARTPSTVVFFTPERIKNVCANNCAHHLDLVRNMLTILSSRYMETEKRLIYLSMKKSRHKLIHYLLDHWTGETNEGGQPVVICRMSRTELSEYLGLTRPSLSRELCLLRDEGFLTFDKRRVTLIDVIKLQQEALA